MLASPLQTTNSATCEAMQGSLPPFSSPILKARHSGEQIPASLLSLSGNMFPQMPNTCAEISSSPTPTLIQGQSKLPKAALFSGSATKEPLGGLGSGLSIRAPESSSQQTIDRDASDNKYKSASIFKASDHGGSDITIFGISLSNKIGQSHEHCTPKFSSVFSSLASHEGFEQPHGSYSIISNTFNGPFVPVSLPTVNATAYSLQDESRSLISLGLPAGEMADNVHHKASSKGLLTSKPSHSSQPPPACPSFSVIGKGSLPLPVPQQIIEDPSSSSILDRDSVAAFTHLTQSAAPRPKNEHFTFAVKGESNFQRQNGSSPKGPLGTPRTEVKAVQSADSALTVVENCGEQTVSTRPSTAKVGNGTDRALSAQARTLISRHKLLLQSSGCLLPTLISTLSATNPALDSEAASSTAHSATFNNKGASLPWFVNESINGIVHGTQYIKRQSGIVVDSVKVACQDTAFSTPTAAPEKLLRVHLPMPAHEAVARLWEDNDDHNVGITGSDAVLTPIDSSHVEKLTSSDVPHVHSSVPNHLKLLSSSHRSVPSNDAHLQKVSSGRPGQHRPASVTLPKAQSLLARFERDTGKFTQHTLPLHVRGQQRNERRQQRVLLGADAIRAQKLDI